MSDLISRQQANDALRDYLVEKRCPDDGTLTCRLIENEVINKLPSVQPDPCEDAVSRKAVLSMIDAYMNKSVELHYLPTSDGIKNLIFILPSVQPEIIRCKDCKYYKYGICMKIGANKSFYGFCDWAERGEQE